MRSDQVSLVLELKADGISREGWWKVETSMWMLYKKKVGLSVSPPSMHLPCLRVRTCRETATWIEHIAAAVHLVSHPSLCRHFRPDSHSIGLSPSPVPKHSVGKARLNIPPLPCTFTAEQCSAMTRTLHAGMIRTDSTNDALHLEHGKLWTKRCRGLCQLLFILVRYSYC